MIPARSSFTLIFIYIMRGRDGQGFCVDVFHSTASYTLRALRKMARDRKKRRDSFKVTPTSFQQKQGATVSLSLEFNYDNAKSSAHQQRIGHSLYLLRPRNICAQHPKKWCKPRPAVPGSGPAAYRAERETGRPWPGSFIFPWLILIL